jgi:hypothetical protein
MTTSKFSCVYEYLRAAGKFALNSGKYSNHMSYRCAVCSNYYDNLNRHLQTTSCANADEDIISMLSKKQEEAVPLRIGGGARIHGSPHSSNSSRRSFFHDEEQDDDRMQDEVNSDAASSDSGGSPVAGIVGFAQGGSRVPDAFLGPEVMQAAYGCTATAQDFLHNSPMIVSRTPLEAYQEEFRATLRSMGLSSDMEYGFLKLMIEFNLPQEAGDKIIALLRSGCASSESKADTLRMPRTTLKFYNILDTMLKDNKKTDTGIKLMKSRVKLPDLDVFTSNNLTHIDIPYIDPEHFIKSLPERYSFEDLILPKDPLRFDKDHIDDLQTCKRVIRLNRRLRKKYAGVKNLFALPVIPYADGTPVAGGGRSGSVTPWSFLLGIIKRELRERDAGRYFAGYQPEFDGIEFVGSEEAAKTFNRVMTHVTDNFFISLFDALAEKIFTLSFKKTALHDIKNCERVELSLVIRMGFFMGDYPEMQRKCNMKETTNSLKPCRRCLVPSSSLFDSSIGRYPSRDYEEQNRMRFVIIEHSNKTDKKSKELVREAKEYLQAHSVHPGFGGLHSSFKAGKDEDCAFETSPELFVPHEPMHAWELGPCAEIPKLTNLLLKNEKGVADKVLNPKSTAADLRRLLDKRISFFKSARFDEDGTRYVPTFKQGVESLAFLRAMDHRFLCQFYMLAIGDGREFFTDDFANEWVKLMELHWKIGHMLYSPLPFNEKRLHTLDSLCGAYGLQFKEVFGNPERAKVSGCGMIKLHCLCHVVEEIMEFGHPRNYNGHGCERSHKIFVRAAFSRTNRSSTARETTKLCMTKRVAYHAMLEEAKGRITVAKLRLEESGVQLECTRRKILLATKTLANGVTLISPNGILVIMEPKSSRHPNGYRNWRWKDGCVGRLADLNDIPALREESKQQRVEMAAGSRCVAPRMVQWIEDLWHKKRGNLFSKLFQNGVTHPEFKLYLGVKLEGFSYMCDPAFKGGGGRDAYMRYDYVRISGGENAGGHKVDLC